MPARELTQFICLEFFWCRCITRRFLNGEFPGLKTWPETTGDTNPFEMWRLPEWVSGWDPSNSWPSSPQFHAVDCRVCLTLLRLLRWYKVMSNLKRSERIGKLAARGVSRPLRIPTRHLVIACCVFTSNVTTAALV